MPEQTSKSPAAPGQAGADGFAFHSFLEEPPLWKQLFQSVRDFVSPPKQPELKLESKPIPVPEIWTRDEKAMVSRAMSIVIHIVVLGTILTILALKPVRKEIAQVVTPIFVPTTPPPPPPDTPVLKLAKGNSAPTNSPKPIPVQQVHALTAPTQIVSLAQALTGPQNMVFTGSGPTGTPGGTGASGGVPWGTCDPTKEDDCVTGVDGISAPVPIYQPDPEYSEEARKAKYQGTVTVDILIGADGLVKSATIDGPRIGMGLDEQAIKAVMAWKFTPANYHGNPLAIKAQVEVNFHLY